MKKTAYMAPAIIVDEMEVQLLDSASITSIDGDTGIVIAGPGETIPGTAQGRRTEVWVDEEFEENF